MENINVLSLFDGMSCGQQALERVGIKVNKYFASEIDKFAIQVTMANYPNTIQLGSVLDVDGYKLPKIDLLMGGSPCQSFSFAGKRKGMSTKCETEILTLQHYLQLKSEGYEFEGQSYLFWEYMRILNEVKPKYFLLENVEMGEKWEKILSKAIGVNGIHINSALVSAQNRKRIYWTNIGMQPMGLFGYPESIIQQPKDKGILLKDILESEVNEKYFLSEKTVATITRHGNKIINEKENPKQSCTIHANYFKMGGRDQQYIRDKQYIVASRGRNPENHKSRESGLNTEQMLEPRYDGKTNCLTNVQKDNYLVCHNLMPRSSKTGKGGTGHLTRTDGKTYCLDTGNTNAVEIKAVMLGRSEAWGMPEKNDGKSYTLCKEQPHGIILTSKDKRLKQTIDENNLTEGKIKALDTYNQSIHDRYPTLKDPKHNDRALFDGSRIRRLTPIECERLQTVADNYTAHVSDSQRYRMLGNGWTIDVICHILSYIK
jgi:DNA (cytosine-5)-methyltransferase 3A